MSVYLEELLERVAEARRRRDHAMVGARVRRYEGDRKSAAILVTRRTRVQPPGAAGAALRRRARRRRGYDRIADNLGAVAATLEAMRAIERHGGAEILDRAFTGFVALPAPEQWFTVLGVSVHASRSEIEEAYRRLAMKHHPDRSAGSAAEMARINVARDEGLEALP